jgi:hypothetical protein
LPVIANNCTSDPIDHAVFSVTSIAIAGKATGPDAEGDCIVGNDRENFYEKIVTGVTG